MTSASEPAASSPAAPAAPPPRPRHPIGLPHFRNLWIGLTISTLGDQFYLVALPWLVLQLTGSSLALGTMLMTAAVPRAALMLVGGAMIDRFSARRVVMATAATRALLVGAVAALVWLGVIRLWHLYLLTFAFGVADAFSFPAGPALIPTLVEPGQLRPANALLQSSVVVSQMVGPAPAGLAIRRWGVAPALFLDAASFLAVLVAIVRLPEPAKAPSPAAGAPPRPSMLHAIAEGLRTVWRDPPLLALMGVFAAINFFAAGPIGVGLPVLAKSLGSAATFGTFLTCFGGGTLAGLVLAGLVKRPRKRGLQILLMGAVTGLELVAIGLAPREAVIEALLALMGLGVGFVNVQFGTWLQTRVERALLGRVMSVLMFCAVGLVPISYALAGGLALWSLPALFAGAGALLAATSILAASSRAARAID
jgi:Major Facilitator Superfamily